MKNWKFIQVGNAESMIEKEIKIIYEANGKDREKAKEYIAKKYPSIARTGQLDRILDEVAGVPARSKNESIDKQEWSMFQGLKKDAEKEIGNDEADLIKRGFVYKVIIPGKKPIYFNNPKQAQISAEANKGTVEKVGNKIGNKAIVLKDGNVWVVLYANETKSQEFESEEEAREFAKKVGNSLPHDYHNRYPSDPIYADMKSSATLEAIKKEPWRVYDIMGVGDSIARERVFEMIEEKYKIDYNDIYEAWMGHSWDKAVQKKSMEDAKRLAQKLGLRFGNKTGNSETVSEYNAEIQRLTKKAEELRRMGQGKSAMEIEKQIEKLGKELRELGNKKAGNAQYGSKEDIISHLDTDLYEIHQRLKQKDESPWRYLSELQKKGYDMGTLSRHNKDIGKIIEKLKTGNETKAEEKFGKVMGEYKEGALKTPQGKTVTDPAQAKAIAYSEADKVDNLKRARNAMNKKK